MRLLKERDHVDVVLWETTAEGYTCEAGEPEPTKDVILARVGVDAAQNYLRHARADPTLSVVGVAHTRNVYRLRIEDVICCGELIQSERK